MVQCTEICSCIIPEECFKKIIYRYFLLEDNKSNSLDNSKMDLRSYGIKIIKEEMFNDNLESAEEDYIENISPNRGKVLGLIEFLKNHEVSPVHLLDVVGDIVDEWIGNFDNVDC